MAAILYFCPDKEIQVSSSPFLDLTEVCKNCSNDNIHIYIQYIFQLSIQTRNSQWVSLISLAIDLPANVLYKDFQIYI